MNQASNSVKGTRVKIIGSKKEVKAILGDRLIREETGSLIL